MPIIVHEEVVDLVEVVSLLDEHDKFLLFETRSFHSTFEFFFCHNQPGTRVFESLLDNQREPEVHMEFVHHIVEDEVDGQDDRREDRQQREESGEAEENQTHNMSAWR